MAPEKCPGCPAPVDGTCPGQHNGGAMCAYITDRDRTAALLAGQPRKPRPAGAGESPPFPPASPPDGRVRYGLFMTCDGYGGAEKWAWDLVANVDPARARCEGIATYQPFVAGPSFRAEWERHCPVRSGPAAMRRLAGRVDVIVAWAVINASWGISPARVRSTLPRGVSIACVSHGSTEYDGMNDDYLEDASYVAVSEPALRGLPAPKRAGAAVIYNGVSAGRVTPEPGARGRLRAEWGIPEGAKVAGFIGRFSPEKGWRHFMDAIAHLPRDWHGVMVGEGWQFEAAKAYAARLDTPGLHLVGIRPDVGNVLAALDCLVVPSDTEGCALVVCEALIAGLPVVGTAVGMLEDRPELARIVPMSRAPIEISSRILWDWHDAEGTAARVARGREFASREMTMDVFARRWTDYITSLAPRPIPPAEQARLSILRNKCPHGTRVRGCHCTDFACSKFGGRKTREQCYACLLSGD